MVFTIYVFTSRKRRITHNGCVITGSLPLNVDSVSSDDLFVEDMKSGLRAVQTVSEQLSVEKESTTVIDLISEAENAVKRFTEATPHNQKRSRILHKPQNAKSDKEFASTLAALKNTLQHVQELHIATVQRQVKRSVV